MKDYIAVCKESSARIIQDAALLVEEWHEEKIPYFGEIIDLQGLRKSWIS